MDYKECSLLIIIKSAKRWFEKCTARSTIFQLISRNPLPERVFCGSKNWGFLGRFSYIIVGQLFYGSNPVKSTHGKSLPKQLLFILNENITEF